jgi:hypothetical protein
VIWIKVEAPDVELLDLGLDSWRFIAAEIKRTRCRAAGKDEKLKRELWKARRNT